MRLGRVLVAANLLSSATGEIEKLIEQVKQLGVPIIGVISDKQHSICLAIERQLPGIAHQLCQYHYLKDLAKPVCEQDRHDSRVPLCLTPTRGRSSIEERTQKEDSANSPDRGSSATK